MKTMSTIKKSLIATSLAASSLMLIPAAHAHFQLLFTPDVNVEKANTLPLRLIFWHPFENGHAMDMGQPKEFFVISKGEKTDLLPSLKPITFKGAENEAKAFAVDLPIKRNGDYVLGLVPEPYYEQSEDIYIQQFTKSFINKGGLPTDWSEPVGMAAEILPLNKPNNVMVGSTFSGIVLANGKPVAGAEIEVEYLSVLPDVATNAVAGKPSVQPPEGGAIVAITDANGVFTFGIPKAGFWGFAALGVGAEKSHKDKEPSQDARIWIHALDLK